VFFWGRPFSATDDYSLVSDNKVPGPVPGQFMYDWFWTSLGEVLFFSKYLTYSFTV
jgi:hypothetical protein